MSDTPIITIAMHGGGKQGPSPAAKVTVGRHWVFIHDRHLHTVADTLTAIADQIEDATNPAPDVTADTAPINPGHDTRSAL